MADHFRRLDELAVEVAALRLIVRSDVAQMLMLSPARMTDTLRAFEEAAAKMSPDEVQSRILIPNCTSGPRRWHRSARDNLFEISASLSPGSETGRRYLLRDISPGAGEHRHQHHDEQSPPGV